MAGYGYFGKGAEGYAHYKQTFDNTFPSSGSRGSYHNTVHSSPSPQSGGHGKNRGCRAANKHRSERYRL